MNRKGFTLIELLAVILILSSIAIVAVVSITSSLDRRDDKECEEQKELAMNAAKIYFSLNSNAECQQVTQKPCVFVKDLIERDYFNEKSKYNKIACVAGDTDCTDPGNYITIGTTTEDDVTGASVSRTTYIFNGECRS